MVAKERTPGLWGTWEAHRASRINTQDKGMERPLDAARGMNKGEERWTVWRSGLAAAHAGRTAMRVEAEPLVTVSVLRPQE